MQINRYINGEKQKEVLPLTVANPGIKEVIEALRRRMAAEEKR